MTDTNTVEYEPNATGLLLPKPIPEPIKTELLLKRHPLPWRGGQGITTGTSTEIVDGNGHRIAHISVGPFVSGNKPDAFDMSDFICEAVNQAHGGS